MQTNDIGTAIVITVMEGQAPVDLSGASGLSIRLDPPVESGLVPATFGGLLWTDGKDGKVYFVTQAGDIPAPGTWKAQAIIGSLGSWSGRTKPDSFQVYANLI